jgi:hypothetical protein
MRRRKWILALGATLGLLTGCLHSGGDTVPPDVLGKLVSRPAEEPHAASPYDARGVPPATASATESPTTTVKNTEPTPPPSPTVAPAQLISREVPPAEPPSAIPRMAGPAPGNFPLEQDTGPVATPPRPAAPMPQPKDPLVSALASFRENRPDEAKKQLETFDPQTREVLAVCLPFLSQFVEQKAADSRPGDWTKLLEQLDHLALLVRPRAALSMEKMCFCRSITRFGDYEPLPAEHDFERASDGRPGELVRVYGELRNVASVKHGEYSETTLACTLLLKDAQEHIVWRQDRPAESERSRSPRQDCFLSCHFYVPPWLPVGDYTLWIEVKDLTGLNTDEPPPHRKARRSLVFRVRNGGPALSKLGERGASAP